LAASGYELIALKFIYSGVHSTARTSRLIDLVAMIVAPAATGAPAETPMSLGGLASIIAGSVVFLALGVLVAHASYRRRKEHDWNVREWNMAEGRAKSRDQELVH
jgi:hypothetical protein